MVEHISVNIEQVANTGRKNKYSPAWLLSAPIEETPIEAAKSNDPLQSILESYQEGYTPNGEVNSTVRRRVNIEPTMDYKEIMQRYGISRSTAWRARQRGWFEQNFQLREVNVDIGWARSKTDYILECARHGAFLAMRRTTIQPNELQPLFEVDDLIQEASVRLIELSGHEKRDIEPWSIVVARNAALGKIQRAIYRGRKELALLDNDGSSSTI